MGLEESQDVKKNPLQMSLHRRDERYRGDRVGDGTQVIEPIPSSYDGEASLIRSSKALRVNRIIVRWIKLEQA